MDAKVLRERKSSTSSPSPKKRKLSENGELSEIAEWSEKDMDSLVESVQKEVGMDAMGRNHSLVFKQLDWSKISVVGFSATQCKKRWIELEKKVRKYRTASEVITDAKEVIKNFKPSNESSHKGPKKPVTPAFMYVNKHREAFKQSHPDMAYPEVLKALFEQYNHLSDKKKDKYNEKYQVKLQEWKVLHKEYLEEHPEKQVKVTRKPKLLTPVQVYINDMLKKNSSLNQGEEGRKLSEKYRSKWSSDLSDSRKFKYISKAILLNQSYQQDMLQYCQKNGLTLPLPKSVLTKAEQKIKDKFDGKPENPPQSGFLMFVKEISTELAVVPMISRMAEASKRWRDLSEEQRKEWKGRCQQMHDLYLEQLREYVQGLPEEQKVQYQAILEKASKKMKKSAKLKKEIKEEAKTEARHESESSE